MGYVTERPRCRQAIIAAGLRPNIDEDGRWSGFQAIDAQGRRSQLSQGMAKQMKLMIAEGYWGDAEAVVIGSRQPRRINLEAAW